MMINKHLTNIKEKIYNGNPKIYLYGLTVLLFWLKMEVAYRIDFYGFQITNRWQHFVILVNPLSFLLVYFAIPLLIKKRKLANWLLLSMQISLSIFLYAFVLYFRAFFDFLTVNTILYAPVSEADTLAQSLTFKWHDLIFGLDTIVLIIAVFLFRKKSDTQSTRRPLMSAAGIGLLFFLLQFSISFLSKPDYYGKNFDRNYIVRNIGLFPFLGFDAYHSHEINEKRNNSHPQDIKSVQNYINKNQPALNPTYAGIAKGKNVIVLHLESLQFSSINLKINGKEVTPFLNSLYKSNSSISFDNFYNQVGQGKTSDAENLLDTSTFGLAQGSLFSQYGSSQVFQALPGILNQQAGYSSAVFHANNPFFYNRNVVYKRMGYQNFISSKYFDNSEVNNASFGIKDKLLFKQSVPYLEKLPQPFYAKYLTVTNHLPYVLDKRDQDPNFKTSNSGSKLVDNYFITNHYLDEAVKEFFDYLKKTGLYDKTMVVLYGDHYGISQTDYQALSTVISKSKKEWTGLDTQNLQKVPFIIHIPGMSNGGINHTYGGEVDVAPTLEHLLGISTNQYLQLGQDLLSSNRSQLVVMRNGDWITPELASNSNAIWDVKTGKKLTKLTYSQKSTVKKNNEQARLKLEASDKLNTENLLNFYNLSGFKKINAASYNYSIKDTVKRLKKVSEKNGSTSLYAENDDKSTYNQYVTNAPEMSTYRYKNYFK